MSNNSTRRNGNDQRTEISSAKFPLRDRQGILVARDRRVYADRRILGLNVTESNLSIDEFNLFFEKYHSNA